MAIGEIIWIFHPQAPIKDVRLVSIGLRISRAGNLMNEVRTELERHSVDGLLPGHWSEQQQTWFFNPEIWACLHSLLLRNNIKLQNLDPYMMLSKIDHTTDVLQCQLHPETYLLWLCDVWEELMDKYQREMRTDDDLAWLKTQRERLVEMRIKWMTKAQELRNQSQSLPSTATSSDESTAIVPPVNTDEWLDQFEEEINDFYTDLQNRQRDS